MFDVFLFRNFVYPPLICPPLPPRPFTPAGVKGSLNSRFGCFGPDKGVSATVCDANLLACVGLRGSRSQSLGAWRGCDGRRISASASGRDYVCARGARRRVQGERSERAHASPGPLGRAEQRSGARIRAGACLSVASLRTTPGGASSARQPAGPRPLARLSFAYFSLAKQRKVRPAAGVSRPAGQNLASVSR
jgi:hypothetical protein